MLLNIFNDVLSMFADTEAENHDTKGIQVDVRVDDESLIVIVNEDNGDFSEKRIDAILDALKDDFKMFYKIIGMVPFENVILRYNNRPERKFTYDPDMEVLVEEIEFEKKEAKNEDVAVKEKKPAMTKEKSPTLGDIISVFDSLDWNVADDNTSDDDVPCGDDCEEKCEEKSEGHPVDECEIHPVSNEIEDPGYDKISSFAEDFRQEIRNSAEQFLTTTPDNMVTALSIARENENYVTGKDEYGVFTVMIRYQDLVHVPASHTVKESLAANRDVITDFMRICVDKLGFSAIEKTVRSEDGSDVWFTFYF